MTGKGLIIAVSIMLLCLVWVSEDIYAEELGISEETCRQLYPCECPTTQPEDESIVEGLDLNELIREENVSLITIFIDRENNITVLYKANEFVSNIEDVKRIQQNNLEDINEEKESKIKTAWRTNNKTLAKEAYLTEELNRDYVKYQYLQNKPSTNNLWEKLISIFG